MMGDCLRKNIGVQANNEVDEQPAADALRGGDADR